MKIYNKKQTYIKQSKRYTKQLYREPPVASGVLLCHSRSIPCFCHSQGIEACSAVAWQQGGAWVDGRGLTARATFSVCLCERWRVNKLGSVCSNLYLYFLPQILGALDLVDTTALRKFVLSTQDPITGGLAKYPNSNPDGLHTYLGISGLALLSKDNLKPVDPALNISQQALSHLHQLHKNISKNNSSSVTFWWKPLLLAPFLLLVSCCLSVGPISHRSKPDPS